MRIKIFIFFFSLLALVLPSTVSAVDYNQCCVCQFFSNTGISQGYTLAGDSTIEQPIIEENTCAEYDGPNISCSVREHELCGEKGITTSFLDEVTFGNIFLGISIPDLHFSAPPTEVDETGNIYIPWIGEYIKAVYNFSMIAISILAVVIIIMQGLRISASAGGPEKGEAAKKITQAVIGLLIAWGSYVILFTINPDLLVFRSLDIRFIDRIPSIQLIEDQPLVSVADVEVNGVPDLKQFDKRWGALQFGNAPRVCQCGTRSDPGPDRKECSKPSSICCTSIQAAGCGATAMAMILRAYGVTGVTPVETAAFMSEKGNGRICNKGVNFDMAISGLKDSTWSNFSGKSVSQEEAYNYLKQGKPIVFLCSGCTGRSKSGTKSYSGHYMVLTGISNTTGSVSDEYTVTVNDPGGNANSGIIYMSESQLKNNNGFWYVYPTQTN